jgi:hypothetical protein
MFDFDFELQRMIIWKSGANRSIDQLLGDIEEIIKEEAENEAAYE